MSTRILTVAASIAIAAALVMPSAAQRGEGQAPRDMTPEELRASMGRDLSSPFVPPPKVNAATSRDWPLNHLDLKNSRYAVLDQINSANVGTLA